MTKAARDIKRKFGVLKYAEKIGGVSKAYRYLRITRQGFYKGIELPPFGVLRNKLRKDVGSVEV